MRVNKYFKEKTAVITGAASGIGREFALHLARMGVNLVISDINMERLERVKKEVESFGIKVVAIKCDVSKSSDVRKLTKISIAEMQDIHFVFSNAGIFSGGPFEYISEEQWEKLINVNVWGAIRVVQAFISKMVEQGSGHVILTSSIAGSMGSAAVIAYSTTKFAIAGFGEALYGEFENKGIDVSIVCPFPLRTNLFEKFELAFPPDLNELIRSGNKDLDLEAGIAHYWNQFTKKSAPFMGFCGGFELERATKRILKGISRKKLYVSERRYLRFFQYVRGNWPGLYNCLLKLSGKRHMRIINETYERIFKNVKLKSKKLNL